MNKNRFWVLIFSLLPGAGEMYLGMMKTGVAIMASFFAIIFFANWLNLEVFLFCLPVLWFYSFFNVHNIKNQPIEVLQQMDDKAFAGMSGFFEGRWKALFDKRHFIVGCVCIFIGFFALFQVFVSPYIHFLAETIPFLYSLLHNLPTLIVSLAIIGLGVFLMRGKRTSVPKDDDLTEFGGTPNE